MNDREPLKIMGKGEIARYFGVSPQLAHKWTKRSDFPDELPVYDFGRLGTGGLWHRDDVIAWARRHKRSKGQGPRTPLGAER